MSYSHRIPIVFRAQQPFYALRLRYITENVNRINRSTSDPYGSNRRIRVAVREILVQLDRTNWNRLIEPASLLRCHIPSLCPQRHRSGRQGRCSWLS